MAHGGGVFVTQNKILPGTYINFVSAAKASATIADRGVCALPLSLDWGTDGKVFKVTAEDFYKYSKELFGYEYTNEKLKGLRDVFLNAHTAYIYKLTSGGVPASNVYGTAKCCGIRGNDLKIIISENVDNSTTMYDVKTALGTEIIDTQTVASASDLVDNDFITFKKDATLTATASTPLTGGTNKTVTVSDWVTALSALESVSFNTLGIVSMDEGVKSYAVTYTKRMRDEVGVKFQTVVYNFASDSEAIINVVNKVGGVESADAVYWVTGAEAGCLVYKSVTNKVYDGEFNIDTNYTQAELEDCIKNGKFVFHQVGDEIRVLTDINSKVTITEEKGEDFKSNQTMRVVDQVGNDIAVHFNTKYLGQIPNNQSGRISLWSDLVSYFKELEAVGAIENFDPESLFVAMGKTKKDVDVQTPITPVNAMERLYMTVTVS